MGATLLARQTRAQRKQKRHILYVHMYVDWSRDMIYYIYLLYMHVYIYIYMGVGNYCRDQVNRMFFRYWLMFAAERITWHLGIWVQSIGCKWSRPPLRVVPRKNTQQWPRRLGRIQPKATWAEQKHGTNPKKETNQKQSITNTNEKAHQKNAILNWRTIEVNKGTTSHSDPPKGNKSAPLGRIDAPCWRSCPGNASLS